MPPGTRIKPASSGTKAGELQPADHLPRVDEASQLRREAHLKDVLGRLDAIPVKRLSTAEQVNAQVFRTVLDNALIEARFRTWEMPFNSDSSFWTYLDARLARQRADARRYIGRMRDIPRYFDEQIVNMRAGLARGFTRAASDACRTRCVDRHLRRPGRDRNPFYAAFKHMPSTMPVAEQFALRDQGVAAIKQQVVPAYREAAPLLSATNICPRRGPASRPTTCPMAMHSTGRKSANIRRPR